MFFIVFSLNLVRIILGWDGLGVVSYILVIFFKNEKSNRAGIITALSNRIGDAALLISISCLIESGRGNYILIVILNREIVIWIVRLAAITKRAQIPFSAWLPAAIAAPTPVRALVHSSTLVTAGVYLLIRFRRLLEARLVFSLLIYLGILTTLVARITALFEVDFKKVVALSTLSQLGIIVTTVSIGFTKIAFMHLLIHAVFKALLFLCRGKIIHEVGGSQDVRKMSGLIFNLPITRLILVFSSFALCGVPFLRGFYRKDLIIENMLIKENFLLIYIIYILLVGLSSRYSIRLISLRVIGFRNQHCVRASREADWTMITSKFRLLVISVVRGALLIWFITPYQETVVLPLLIKWFAFLSIVLGRGVGLVIRVLDFSNRVINKLAKVDFLLVLWNIPELRGSSWVLTANKINERFSRLDSGWLEIFGGQGVNYFMLKGREIQVAFIKNSIKRFLAIFLVSFVILLDI